MTLDPSVLRSALLPIFSPQNMPQTVQQAVVSWGQAYVSYASSAVAGIVALGAPLSFSPGPGGFFESIESGLLTMWTSAVWAGPSATGLTAVVPPLTPSLLALAPVLTTTSDPGVAVEAFSEAFHTYTQGVIVAVTVSGGPPSPVPLM